MKPTVIAHIPQTFLKERTYVLNVMVEDFFGLSLDIQTGEYESTTLLYNDNQVEIPDYFFSSYSKWEAGSLPEVANFSAHSPFEEGTTLPGFFFDENASTAASNDGKLHVDVIGMSFFLLTGFADLVHGTLDQHKRFSGKASFLYKHNLLDRPLLQEWYHVIAYTLFGKAYREILQIPSYSKHISHDVDQPFEYLNYPVSRLLKRLSGDLISRNNFSMARKRLSIWREVQSGIYDRDPFNNFDKLLELFKKEQITSTFFWVSGTSESPFDVTYSLNDKAVQNQLLATVRAGHDIGLHPSYNSLGDADKLREERLKLEGFLKDKGCDAKVTSERKHVLRWNWKESPQALTDAGFKHDYTVGYADVAGFRVGVGFPYRAYNWKSKAIMPLYLHPLIVMECTLLDQRYMNLNTDEAFEKIESYHKILSSLGGEFVLLWHNHRLADPTEMNLFKKFISL